MRELTVQELEQTSGGIAPIIGLALAIGGMIVRHQGTRIAVEAASVALAAYGVYQYGQSQNSCNQSENE